MRKQSTYYLQFVLKSNLNMRNWSKLSDCQKDLNITIIENSGSENALLKIPKIRYRNLFSNINKLFMIPQFDIVVFMG